jgi:AcrR family transcriptional regulator
MNHVARRYELKRRAERQEETRRRIVEAAVALHEAHGPARSTVTQIAERAGVGRLTVYRHFPDETALLWACSGLYFERNPFPDPEPLRAIADPTERLRVALRESYGYHRRTEAMMRRALVDAAGSPIIEPYHEHWHRVADVVVSAWRVRGRERSLLRAAIGHAVTFPTWYSLVRDQGLTDEQAVELMLRLTCDCGPESRHPSGTQRSPRSSRARGRASGSSGQRQVDR